MNVMTAEGIPLRLHQIFWEMQNKQHILDSSTKLHDALFFSFKLTDKRDGG